MYQPRISATNLQGEIYDKGCQQKPVLSKITTSHRQTPPTGCPPGPFGGECLCDSVILQKKRFAGFDICNNLCLTLRSKIRSPNVINLNSVPHVCTWCRSCVHSKEEEVHAGLKQRPKLSSGLHRLRASTTAADSHNGKSTSFP